MLSTLQKPLLVLVSLFAFSIIQAQDQHDHDLCLTEFNQENQEQFDKSYRSLKKSNFKRRLNEEMILIPVTYHIVRKSDGTGGITQQQIDRAMERVNGIYEQFGMSFYQCGPTKIHNNNDLYNYDREGAAPTAIQGLDVNNTYNMYFCNDVNDACGFAYFPGSSPDRTVLSNGCITNGTTLEHEIGHSYNLPHTHQGNGNENVARPGEGNANCTTKGDRFCDTEADPKLSGTTQNSGTCNMSGLGNGPDGLAYRTDGTNIMSYAPRKNCRTVFSQEQMDMMYFTAKNNSDRTKFRCTQKPIANFKAAISNYACVGHEIQLEDQSYGDQQLVWNWTTNGGNIVNNTVENPTVTYNSTGSYSVSLQTSNGRGNNTETKNNFIKVVNPLSIPYTQDFSSGSSVLNEYDVKTNSQSNVAVNTSAGRSGNGLQLTARSTNIYYVKAKKERAFHNNPAYTSSVTIPCLDATNFENLELKFDLKLLYSSNRYYTTFRILVNGKQLGATTNLTADSQENWNTVTKDLTAYVGKPVYITFEANTRSKDVNSVYIDNIRVTGTKSTSLQPIISTDDATEFCEGESSTLVASVNEPGSYTYQWKKNGENIDGASSQTYAATSSGNYSVYVSNGNDDGESSPVSVSMINTPVAPNVEVTPVCGQGTVLMETGNHALKIKWYESMTSQSEINTGNSYSANLNSTQTYYIEPITRGKISNVGAIDTTLGEGGIHTGGLYMVVDAYKDFILKSAKVFAQVAKNRTLELRDVNDVLIDSKVVFIEAGESIVNFDLFVPAGNDYKIGFPVGDDLYRNKKGANYPYTVNNLLSIKTSTANNPDEFYYYLYNWEVEEVASGCVGEKVPVEALVIQKPATPTTSDVTICGGDTEPVTLEASLTGSQELRWYESENATNSIGTGENFTIQTSPSNNEDYFVEGVTILMNTLYGAAKDNTLGGGSIHAGNQYLIFNASEDFVFKSATVYAEVAKNRTLELRNENGTVITSKVINIPVGESRIDINFSIPAGNYQIGFPTGSDLFRNNDEVSYPYTVGSIVSIDSSTAQSDPYGFYYYLYDWEIETAGLECAGERAVANVIVDVCTGTKDNQTASAFSIYPNPASEHLEITYNNYSISSLQLINSLGNTVYSSNEALSYIDLSAFRPGIYYLSARSATDKYIQKIIIK